MFLGEFGCLVAYLIWRLFKKQDSDSTELESHHTKKRMHPIFFLPPAFCDLLATSLSYIALNITYTSSYQMFKSSVIIFTGILSCLVLKTSFSAQKCVGIILVTFGLFLVGLSDFLFGSDSGTAKAPILGDVIIVFGTLITSIQVVIEEKLVVKNRMPPLLAVGWEGVFGLTMLGLLVIPLYFIKVPFLSSLPDHRLEDPYDAFVQIKNAPTIGFWVVVNVVTIGFFNFAGICVTKELSATTRMVFDSFRSFFFFFLLSSLTIDE
eukprot:TRINITY_DN4860_c0_g1_i1.p1 TRINITY_DN4860_c0_g1~~TRINITY_DN4860_c0_g1_i1.p1  ORF type:complete len:265 (+),score=32.49 TRINITY_DN4860_c0_g1_i1:287-1081(+)